MPLSYWSKGHDGGNVNKRHLCFFIGLRFLHGVSTNFLLCPFHSFRGWWMQKNGACCFRITKPYTSSSCFNATRCYSFKCTLPMKSHQMSWADSDQTHRPKNQPPTPSQNGGWWLSKGSLPRFFSGVYLGWLKIFFQFGQMKCSYFHADLTS